MDITLTQLQLIMPRMARNPKTAAALLPHLNAAMEEAKINTALRQAAFLAQVAHESFEFKYTQEVWGPTPQQLRYEPPTTLAAKLGNTQKGDGYRYRGRGPIQLTGRSNYRACGKALGLDLEADPDLAARPENLYRIACWFWTSRDLNALADRQEFDAITKKVNGGFNGKTHRDAYYAKALDVLIDVEEP